MTEQSNGLSTSQRVTKRVFDVVVSFFGIVILWPVILVGWIVAAISTRANGFFVQKRVGLNGEMFSLFKLRSMRQVAGVTTSVTSDKDVRITATGRVLRKLKIDELPQLFNVLAGQMSLVGPRPDVSGFADKLQGDDRLVLSVRPGITGPASIAFRNEEETLAGVENPEVYNREVIWPEKVRINKAYIRDYSLASDLKYILQTIIG